jgi:hypothetical protein
MQTGSSETLIGWNLEKSLMTLYGTEWRERGYGLRADFSVVMECIRQKSAIATLCVLYSVIETSHLSKFTW